MAHWLYCCSCQQWSKSTVGLKEDLPCSFCGNLFVHPKTSIKLFPEPEKFREEPAPIEEPSTIAEETASQTTNTSEPSEEFLAAENDQQDTQQAVEPAQDFGQLNDSSGGNLDEAKPAEAESEAVEKLESQESPSGEIEKSNETSEEAPNVEEHNSNSVVADVSSTGKRKKEKIQEIMRRMKTPR